MNRPNPLVFLLFFLSGATGLVYELIWTRELIFVFGGTTYAISTVLVVFMAGLGLGIYLCVRYSRSIRDAARFYGLLEIAIGVYALLVPYLLDAALPI
ncbi:MAG: spermidine synthase, partial [Planctomycetes bacterium]|nr:spermidine synthase [Planctomycetota bacterium]